MSVQKFKGTQDFVNGFKEGYKLACSDVGMLIISHIPLVDDDEQRALALIEVCLDCIEREPEEILKASTDNDCGDVAMTFEKVIRDIGKLEKFYTHLSEQIGWIRGSIEGMDERLSDLDVRLEQLNSLVLDQERVRKEMNKMAEERNGKD